MNDSKRAVAYLRVSTDDQHLGIEAQRAAVSRWAVANKIEVVSWHEEHVSGGADIAKRPGVLDAVHAVKTLGAGILVVAKRDRLARDVMNAALLRRMTQEAGGQIVSAAGEGDGDSAEDRLMQTIIDAVAEWERARIALRVREALAVKKARGERVGAIPLGKRLGDDGKTLEPDPDELDAVGRVLELHEGGHAAFAIARRLTDLGVRTRSGGPWHAKQVERILRRYGDG